MRTLTLKVPEQMAQELTAVNDASLNDFVIQVLQAGLQKIQRTSETAVEHPYVTHVPGKRGGRAIIRNTGITVALIASLYKAGDTVDDILESYPHLHPSWVHDAIGYYLDHKGEIEREIRANRMERLAQQHDLTIDKRGFVHFPE
ncbi:MAG: DUF433 domain-containing protein [Chloroflexi bacterium]|nr:DUF433 domain-containing protein [Chloroflexota bacterium]